MTINSGIDKPTSNLKEKKLLKSCIRCRKHKTKCDSHLIYPGPCSNCQKKNLKCIVEYISPPKRFDNLKNLNKNIQDLSNQINSMVQFYEIIKSKFNIDDIPNFNEFKLDSHNNIYNTNLQLINLKNYSNNSTINDYSDSDNYNEEDENDNNDSIDTSNELNCLLRLSNNKFINLTINHKFIKINDDQYSNDEITKRCNDIYHKISKLFKSFQDNEGNENNETIKSDIFEKDLVKLFKDNKLLFMILSQTSQSLTSQFLQDYINSYSSIILKEKLNFKKSISIIFSKPELCSLINLKFFNNDKYLSKILKTLMINYLITGDLEKVIKFVKIIQFKLNLNRKNFNFDKNLSINWKYLLKLIVKIHYQDQSNFNNDKKNEENLDDFLNEYNIYIAKLDCDFLIVKDSFINCIDEFSGNDVKLSKSKKKKFVIEKTVEFSIPCHSKNAKLRKMDKIKVESDSDDIVPSINNSITDNNNDNSSDNLLESDTEPSSIDGNNELRGLTPVDDKNYEVILEKLIDWQKDSTDDVLSKINQFVKTS
ncbi:hypothetical protein WICMUC_000511 [Wickerhamomyces mucosus]|uniref:Zn(2)-C6 fungal-type domain-containing protein n=1 Tax=Wickerhamomyces mucosus TaxID=1378264 RepID=A0A9P8PYX1_9ASCO|nr:hypothetical protein WICMUC_000511 [Wickerhamomyces mucosus]